MPDTLQAPVPTKRNKISVYFLASPEDEDECKAIQKYLSPVIRNSRIPIEIGSDFIIPAGEDTEKYKQRLYEADIVLAFISADFINNDETYQRTKKVIARYNNNETLMLPILVRNCLWKSTPFVNLPLLPKNFQPLNNKQFWNSDDDAFTAVVSDIYDSINKISDIEMAQPAPSVVSENIHERHAQRSSAAIETETPLQKAAQQPANFVNLKEQTAYPQIQPTANIPLNADWRKQYYKAAVWKRGAAFFLDNLLTMLPVMGIAFVIASVLFVGEDLVVSDTELTFICVFTLGVYFIVCAAMESSKWRGTFGKRIMKLQITDREGHPVSFFRAFSRNIIRFVIGYSYLFIIPLVIQYFTFKKTKQLFHDQLSSTVIGEKLTSGA